MATPAEAVSVYHEPFHRVELEHPLFRVIRFRFPPGERTLFHRHFVDSFFCFFNDAKITLETASGKDEKAIVRGTASHAPYTDEPIVHRIENVGATWMHGLDIEVNPPAAPKCVLCNAFVTGVATVVEEPHFERVDGALPRCCPTPKRVRRVDPDAGGSRYDEITITHDAVALYRLTLAPGESTETFSSAAPRLFVWYEDGSLRTTASGKRGETRPITEGSYAFDDRAFHGKLANAGETPLTALVAVWSLVPTPAADVDAADAGAISE